MKKLSLLCGAISLISMALAQSPKMTNPGVMQKSQSGKVFVDNDINKSNRVANQKSTLNRRSIPGTAAIRIGSTYYDLQTNYAMPHRLVMHKDGSVSAGWTSSYSGAQGFPGRGTGYNFRSVAGNWYKSDSNRVESVRTGWPNIGVLSNGNVFTIAHDATAGGFYMTVSSSETSKPSSQSSILQDAPYKPIWARTANSGDTIHLICSYTDSASPGEKRAPTRKGIFAPMVYSRSLDGGKTWDIKHSMLPNYDSTLTNNGGADQYAIDARGKTVVIANADLTQGVILWKSTDFGSTWKRIDAELFKYAPYNSKKLMTDTPFTTDGTVDVLIDASGKVHAFWGLSRMLDTDTADQSYSFFPGFQNLVYWNESMTSGGKVIASGSAFDATGDGVNTMEQATYSAASSTGLPSGVSTVARLGNTSCLRQPSAAVDANGNIYCTFSIPIEQDISDLGANFRDIGVVYSKDGGTSWSTPQNVTQNPQKEDDFACVSRTADGFLHMMWQQDDIPGTNLQNNISTVANHDVVLNVIYYQAIPVSDILNDKIGLVSVEQPNTGEVMVVNQNYPNPFEGTTNVLVWLTRPGDVQVEVSNMMGQVVKTQTEKDLNRGNHIIAIDGSGLPSGIYTYSLIAGGNKVSKTMIVK